MELHGRRERLKIGDDVGFVTPTVQFAAALLVAVLLLWAATFALRLFRSRSPRKPALRAPMPGPPWLLPEEPALPGVAADAAKLGDVIVRGTSIVGPRHRHQRPGRPRQDAYRLAQDSAGDHLVVAVADGATPAGLAGLGANLATTTMVNELRRRLDQGVALEELTAVDTFSAISQAMVDGAQLRGIPMSALYTTLIVMIVPSRPGPTGARVAWLAHIGNSSAWLNLGTKWQHLAGDNSADNSALLPFQPEHATAALVDLPRGATIALLTDGLATAFTRVASGQRHFAQRWRTPPSMDSFLRDVDLLDAGFDARNLSDDRTAVVMWCGAA